MKPLLLALALPVIALTGCAGGGYVGSDGGYYAPGYAYGPGYYDGSDIGIAFYDSRYNHGVGPSHGRFAHDYRDDSVTDHHSFATASRSSSFHGTTHVASTRSVGHTSSGGHTASVSSGAAHISGGGSDRHE